MVQKWQKQVQKIEQGTKREIIPIIESIIDGSWRQYDADKMVGYPYRYRIRTGKYRVVFDLLPEEEPKIIRVQKR